MMRENEMAVLLLNASYEPMRFITQQRAIKLLLKDKVDVIDIWEDKQCRSVSMTIEVPATIRIKKYVTNSKMRQFRFSKNGVFNRDRWRCQYCNIFLNHSTATVDHVISRARGGKTTWQNCVTSCIPCNLKKSDKSLSEVGYKLLSNPCIPTHLQILQGNKNRFIYNHHSWESYFK